MPLFKQQKYILFQQSNREKKNQKKSRISVIDNSPEQQFKNTIDKNYVTIFFWDVTAGF